MAVLEETSFKPRMAPNDPNKLNIRRTLFLSFGFLSVLVVLTYYNIAVPIILYDVIPEDFSWIHGIINVDVLVGILMTLDNILAVTLQPYFASLSDRTRSKFGRRMPYIIIGITGCALFFGFAPLIHNFKGIISWIEILIGFVSLLFMYNLFMSFYRSPGLAILADYTPDKQRSVASGIQQFIANIGTIFAFILSSIIGLFVSKQLDKDFRDVLIAKIGFPIISALMILCLLVLIFTLKETPTGDKFFELSKEKISLDSVTFNLKSEEKVDNDPKDKGAFISLFTKKHRSLLFVFLAVFFWFTAFGALEAFFSKFATEYLELGLDTAMLIGVVYPAAMILSAIPTGILGKKVGRKKTLIISVSSLIVLLTLLSFIVVPLKNIIALAITLVFVGIFWMSLIVNTFPVVWKLAPEKEIGTFTGFYYTFNQSAAILGPILMGAIFNIASIYIGKGNPERFKYIFPFMLGCLVIALLCLIPVKGGESEE
ncbi:MAG: MFS transporter [Candidatus Heimdallarchaeaceae archaeon]